DPHETLRLAIRKQMLQPGLPRQKQKRLVPNTYVVPTMKSREALRWGVRWDLARCLMPRR
ncbi:HYLS1 protein, partial [Dasyornis broadbenti]|nr:HYLS1 protein [Dasyornis broadbenti]